MSDRHASLVICLSVIALPLLLAGCGSGDDMARTFGLVHEGPDEFRVTTRAPLSMPPEFNLPPPRPGAARPQETSTTQQAAAALAPEATLAGGDPAPAAGGPSGGQSALVSAAAAHGGSDPAGVAEPSRSLTDRLMFWQGGAPSGDAVLDPDREAERLRNNAALGKAPDAGATPVVPPPKQGFFSGLTNLF